MSPQFSDDLYLGPVYRGGPLSDGPAPMDIGIGPLGRIYVFDVVPLTLQAAGLAALQQTAGAANLVLTAGTGVTTQVGPDGVTRYVLDTPRCVTLTSAGNLAAVTFTVTGYDQYGQLMTQALAGPNANTVATLKAFKSITRVAVSAAVGADVSVGFNDTLGLPIRVIGAGYVASVKWAGVLAADAGTFVAAVQTSPATNATGDVRGTYTPSSAADGSRRLVMAIAVPAIGCGPNATRVGALGVTQA